MKHILQLTLGLLLCASAAFAQDSGFQPKFVDSLVGSYLTIQKGLSGDDLKAAQAGTNSFLEAMKHAPADIAKSGSSDLSNSAKAIAEAPDIKAARNAFQDLSHEMITLVQHVETSNDTQLFVAHCPMAFDHKGGDWLQADKNVTNPYYGSMMLRCGSIQKQVAGKTDAPDEHSSHSDDHPYNPDHHKM